MIRLHIVCIGMHFFYFHLHTSNKKVIRTKPLEESTSHSGKFKFCQNFFVISLIYFRLHICRKKIILKKKLAWAYFTLKTWANFTLKEVQILPM